MNAKYLKQWCVFVAAIFLSHTAFARAPMVNTPIGAISAAQLPPEARQTLALIKRGGPFPYPKDGVVFGNYERILPKQSRGYYHELTVKTPGLRSRGARRLIVGGALDAPHEFFYTADHYATFMRITE